MSESPATARLPALTTGLRDRGADFLLVEESLNLRYLTGFTGSNGLAVIAADPERHHRFLTDFRYETQSATEVDDSFDVEVVSGDLLERAVTELATDVSVAFDDANLTVKRHARLLELAQGRSLVACGGLVETLREIKDPSELDRIRAATALADEALRGIIAAGVVGKTERDVAIDLELAMRRLGAEGPSFPSIVASAAHSALPHAEPRDVAIAPDVLLTIDWGARLDGYCSDCTRTLATGDRLPDGAREVYALVLHAQLLSLAAVAPDRTGREIDAIAREAIERGGYGDRFGHGLGHGVGIDIHEAPRLSKTGGDAILRVGNVVTVEPGIYLPDRFGVRIEDLVVLTPQGHEVLTGISKELTVVG